MRRTIVPCLVPLVLAFLGCTSTRIVESWTAPGLQPEDLRFEHVVALAIAPEGARQRLIEDTLAAEATRTQVTPAYTIVADEDRADPKRLRAVLEEHGIDGAVVVHLVSAREKQTYVPGSTRVVPGGFYGYYGRMSTVVYDPGYVRTDTEVVVETSLYDVSAGKLLWSGTSETLNPPSTNELIHEIVAAARDELREKGLLP